MGKLDVQDLTHRIPYPPRTTHAHGRPRPLSAARIRTAPTTAGAARQPLGLRPLRQGPATGCCTAAPARPASPSSRAPRFSTPSCRTRRSWRSSAPCRWLRRPPDRPVGGGQQGHRHPTGPAGRQHARPPTTSSWLFPPGPVRSSSTRNGPSSPRSRRTATPTTRPMTSGGTTGTTSPTTPSTSWSWRCPRGADGRERRGDGRRGRSSGSAARRRS